jgi:hypothetical protein
MNAVAPLAGHNPELIHHLFFLFKREERYIYIYKVSGLFVKTTLPHRENSIKRETLQEKSTTRKKK